MTAVRTQYRYGASYSDRALGWRFEGHHPLERPDLWRQYVEGCVREYERYGIGELVDRPTLERADGVPLFFVGIDLDERVVAGVRCHGPLDAVADCQALAEMVTSPEIDGHRASVQRDLPHGVIELKGAWRELSGDHNQLVPGPFSRVPIHALEWLGAEVALTAVAERMEPPLELVGARRMGRESAPFPSERYRTVLLALRRARYGALAQAEHLPHLRQEAEELVAGPGRSAVTGWRPIVLDLRRRADRQVLANLRADPATQFVDLADRQRAELSRLLPAPSDELLAEPLRWVYYPWRRTAVRMLGPEAFSVVRLDRNRNRITREEQRRLRHQRVGVVGLSAGHPVAAALALEGLCGELRLADFDDVALTNLNRLPGAVLDVGANKALVAARRVAEVDPYLPVEVVPAGLSPDTVEEFVAGLDVVVEECDDLAMKVLVREVARQHRVPVVMETSDRGLLDVERFDQEPGRPLLHGLLPGITAARVASMSPMERVALVVQLVDPVRGSDRGAASLVEVGRTLATWPQLGSDVTLGGASVAAAVRRLGLGEPVPSGRARVDLESVVGALESPPAAPAEPPPPLAAPAPAPADPLLALAHAASLAPSGGNAQPWRFELSDGEMGFVLDRSRSSAMDLRSRASYVAVGAALLNTRVAAAASGQLGPYHLFPDGAGTDRVAVLALEAGRDDGLAALAPWVGARCSNRRLGAPQPLEVGVVAELGAATAAEGGTLHLVTDRERLEECAEVLGACERLRLLTPQLHREMFGELRWPGQDATAGIDVRTLEMGPGELAALRLLQRPAVVDLLGRWKAGGALGDHVKPAVRSASALAVVTVPDASPASYVRGGGAVERLWLGAQRAGLGVQPVPPLFAFAVQHADYERLVGPAAAELAALADRFRSAVGLSSGATIALVLRLAHAAPPSTRSARLPLEEVVRRPGSPTAAGPGGLDS